MAVVSYRLYCQECSNEEVVREDAVDDSHWKVVNLVYNEGLCPACNDAVNLSDLDDGEQYEKGLDLEELDNIGEKAAKNLREAGYDTYEAISRASDEELLSVAWVGEKALFSLKEAAHELEPQKRW
jgi:DNA-directed RNA polymerase alpha subunit